MMIQRWDIKSMLTMYIIYLFSFYYCKIDFDFDCWFKFIYFTSFMNKILQPILVDIDDYLLWVDQSGLLHKLFFLSPNKQHSVPLHDVFETRKYQLLGILWIYNITHFSQSLYKIHLLFIPTVTEFGFDIRCQIIFITEKTKLYRLCLIDNNDGVIHLSYILCRYL